MPEGRDRLIREENTLTSGFGGGGIRFDSPPPPPIGLFNAGRGGVGRFVLFGSPRLMRSDVMGVCRSPVVVARQRRPGHGGQENSRLRRRETSSSNSSVLPSWYPRRPLQDVSTVVRAIERRRARLADTEHHRLASPTPEELGVPVPELSTVDAPLEHEREKKVQTLMSIRTRFYLCNHVQVDWLNRFKAICGIIRSTAEPIFAEYIGKYQITSIEFEKPTLGTLPPTIHAGGFQFFAAPRVILKPLVPTFPCFPNIVVSLMEKPHVDFGLKFLRVDLMVIPGLY